MFGGGNTTGGFTKKKRPIEFGPYPSYAIAYANALVEKLEGEAVLQQLLSRRL